MINPPESQILLIVEDNAEDCEAITRAFKKVQLRNPIFWCKSGQEALDYLKGEGSFKDKQQLPGLILLDLNMPGIDGQKTLQIIKKDENLKKIPVIILTTSGNERDIAASFQEGANSYVQKPVTFEGLINAMKGLKEYWFEISILPKE
jgi:two-component system response regulator